MLLGPFFPTPVPAFHPPAYLLLPATSFLLFNSQKNFPGCPFFLISSSSPCSLLLSSFFPFPSLFLFIPCYQSRVVLHPWLLLKVPTISLSLVFTAVQEKRRI